MSRQIVLRLMLVILGIAAALAIYSIFQSSETSWRIVGTAFTLAVTIGLIVPFVPADAGQRVDLLQRTVIGHWTLGGGLVIGVIRTDMLVGRSSTEELLGIWALAGNPALLVAAIAMRSRRKQDRSLARAENIAIIGAFASFGAAVLTEQVSNAMGIDDALQLGERVFEAHERDVRSLADFFRFVGLLGFAGLWGFVSHGNPRLVLL